jgi:DNA-directed RNA polymerase beta subunit
MNCSDSHLAYVCIECGDILNVFANVSQENTFVTGYSFFFLLKFISEVYFNVGQRNMNNQSCSSCKSESSVRSVHIPYVFRYLTNELAGMGIKLSLRMAE